jgi:topoisomerase IA-like protein
MPDQKQITLEEALKLVKFQKNYGSHPTYNRELGEWYVDTVKGYCRVVEGNCDTVEGNCHHVVGDCDTVEGMVITVEGGVFGRINGRKWRYVETPKEKFERLLGETGNEELIEAFNQLEDN